MKILVCSDSHNNSILKLPLDDYDYIIHSGDILSTDIDYFSLYPNLYYVKGNCDYNNYPTYLNINILNKNIFITHSHLYNTKYRYNDLILNTKDKYDLVIFGHTHVPTLFKEGNTIYLNPGAFKNKEYVVIEDNKVIFYKDNKIKEIKYLNQ